MAGLTPVARPELSALIQIQGGAENSSTLQALKTLQRSSLSESGNTETRSSTADAKAIETANKFESLLIHSMLKGMRKTTMSENTTNQRAMYDDMLDKQLADTMVEAGGLGVAKQLLSQLNVSNEQADRKISANEDLTRLRKLAAGGNMDLPTSTNSNPSTTSISELTMASGLWSNSNSSEDHSFKQQFTEPLTYHAHRSAERLGTSPSAILAIAALETGWGRSLPKNSQGESTNNYFGIKASPNEKNFSENSTKEYIDGELKTVRARFKSYDTAADSVSGFADFIIENPRYAKAIEHAGDPERFLTELQKAGYATDPKYAEKAISILHQINQQLAKL